MKQLYSTRQSRRTAGTLLSSGLVFLLAAPGLVQAQALPQYSLPFNGTNQYVAVTNRAALEFTTGTIEMWVKPDWAPGSHGGANVCLAAERPLGNNSTRFSLHMQNNLSGIGIWNGINYSTRNFSFTRGKWYHVAFVMTTSDTEIFVDGVSIGKTGNGINTAVTGASLCFGAANSASTGELFEGELDEIRVWNAARTAEQISANKSVPVSASSSGLLAYYPVDANVLNTSNATARLLKDYTSNSYNGTLYNYSYIDPTIVRLLPTRNASSVAREMNVAIGFSANMSNATASDAAIKVFGSQTGKRAGVFSGGGTNIIAFDPAKDLKPGEKASVTVTNAAATNGATLTVPQVYQFTGATAAAEGTFNEPTSYALGADSKPQAVSLCDINKDGNLDLVAATGGNSTVSVLLGSDTGALSSVPATYSTGVAARGLTTGDINGDGNPDIVVSLNNNNIGVMLGSNSGVFGAMSTYAAGQYVGDLELVDMNGDGNLDVVVSSTSDVRILLGTGSGSLRAAARYSLGINNSTGLAVGDLNGDGQLDVVSANYNEQSYSVLLGSTASPGTLGAATVTAVDAGSFPFKLTLGDVNGDEVLDLAICYLGSPKVDVRLGTGSGNFGAPNISMMNGACTTVALADLTGDGNLDLIATNSGYVYTLKGLADGTFAAIGTIRAPNTVASTGDFNNDGRLDIATVNAENGSASVLLSQTAPTITSFTPSSGSAGEEVILTGTSFTGATSVKFNGTAATSFVVNSATQITTTVPNGATTGTISVTTPAGTATSAQSFIVPVITDLVVSDVRPVTGSYRNVTITSSGVAMLQGNINVTGNFVVQNGGSLNLKGNAVTGNSFELQDGGTLTIGGREGIAATGNTGGIQTATRFFSSDANYVYGSYQKGAVTGSGLPIQVRSLAVVDIYGDNETYLSLTNDLAVAQTLRLDYDLTTAGKNLTLLSTPTKGTALVFNNGGVVQGNVTVQRAIDSSLNPGAGYRHFSSPVQNTTVADLATNGYSPVVNADYNTSTAPGLTQPYPTVFGYDAGAQVMSPAVGGSVFDKGWVSPGSVNDKLAVGRGYTVNFPASETVDFVGTLNNGPISVPLTSGAGADASWQLVGNPFPSPLDWSYVKRPQDVDDALYVYESNSQYQGSWRTAINGIGDPVVPSGQGFFVHLSNPNTSTALTFSNGARVTSFDTQPTMKRGAPETRPLVQLTLSSTHNALTDNAYVYFQPEATTGIDARYDALKIQHNAGGAPSVYSLSAGKELSINGLPTLETAAALPLGIELPKAGTYTLEAAQLLNLSAATVYLVDHETGEQINMAQQPRYTFTATAAARTNTRFELRFVAGRTLSNHAGLTAASLSVYPNPAHHTVTVLVPAVAGAKQVVAALYNNLGQLVRQQTAALPAAGAQVPFDINGLPAGAYILRVQIGQQHLTKQVLVQ